MDCILLWIEAHPGLAAWMQAFFSVLAVVAAFSVSDRHFKKSTDAEKARRFSEDERRLGIVDAVLVRIYDIAIEMQAATKKSDADYFSHLNTNLLVDLRRSLISIPIMDIPSARVVVPITALPQALQEIIDLFERARSPIGPTDADYFYDLLVADDMEDMIEKLLSISVNARSESLGL